MVHELTHIELHSNIYVCMHVSVYTVGGNEVLASLLCIVPKITSRSW